MTEKKSTKKKEKKLSPRDLLKIEIAHELGLWDKVQSKGWAELTAVESGRIGGILTRKLKEIKKQEQEQDQELL